MTVAGIARGSACAAWSSRCLSMALHSRGGAADRADDALVAAAAADVALHAGEDILVAGLGGLGDEGGGLHDRSEEHTSELQSLMRISYAVFCLKKKTDSQTNE